LFQHRHHPETVPTSTLITLKVCNIPYLCYLSLSSEEASRQKSQFEKQGWCSQTVQLQQGVAAASDAVATKLQINLSHTIIIIINRTLAVPHLRYVFPGMSTATQKEDK
jgi:hypothetical protein